MSMKYKANEIRILDCTLRDGGYINDWNWGFDTAKGIIDLLVRSKVEVIEVGFLRNVDNYNKNVTVCNKIQDLNKLLPTETGTSIFSAMAMQSNYDLTKLEEYCGNGISMVRVTAHDYDITEGLKFAKGVKERGYMVSFNPINIMGYDDERIIWIVDMINKIKPEQFAIVDTFGSMRRRDLDRIVSLVDHNLDDEIALALHLHENMSLSCSIAQSFLDKHLNRRVAVDGSLMGMGRVPGNLPIELIADYLNEYYGKDYDIEYMLDAIQEYIYPIKKQKQWGYDPIYFLSARFNLHRNYSEFYSSKGDLTTRDINLILSTFDKSKCTAFDKDYAEQKYLEFKNQRIDDSYSMRILKQNLSNHRILLLVPGESIVANRGVVEKYINENSPLILSVNFVPEYYDVDYSFFGNNLRFSRFKNANCKKIVTSNIKDAEGEIIVNLMSVSDNGGKEINSFIMALRLLDKLGINSVDVAGADGIIEGKMSFFDESIHSVHELKDSFNDEIHNTIDGMNISVNYITPSAYE